MKLFSNTARIGKYFDYFFNDKMGRNCTWEPSRFMPILAFSNTRINFDKSCISTLKKPAHFLVGFMSRFLGKFCKTRKIDFLRCEKVKPFPTKSSSEMHFIFLAIFLISALCIIVYLKTHVQQSWRVCECTRDMRETFSFSVYNCYFTVRGFEGWRRKEREGGREIGDAR